MRFIDIYFEYKKKYNNYIIIYRIGNFYNVFGSDSQIIAVLTNYKINIDKETIKVGFPIIALDRVLKKLHEEKINYILLEKTDGIINIKFKKRYKDNMYEYFTTKGEECYEYKKKIDNINKILLTKIYDI